MKFYRFDSRSQFEARAGTSAMEFTHDGQHVSVVGLVPDGTETPVLDGRGLPTGEMQPTYKAGWHVNTSGPIEGWKDYLQDKPRNPIRVMG